jgi:hypothetical protein
METPTDVKEWAIIGVLAHYGEQGLASIRMHCGGDMDTVMRLYRKDMIDIRVNLGRKITYRLKERSSPTVDYPIWALLAGE